MKKLIILSLAVFLGLIYSDYTNAETGIQIARTKATILGEIKSDISRSSSPGKVSNYKTVPSASLSARDQYDRSRYIDALGLSEQNLRKISPHPLRYSCAKRWNDYYEKENINIKVKSRGNYDQAVQFFCHTCNNAEHFVRPFLKSEYQGMTGFDRIKSCGFEYIIFKGGRGYNEVIIDVTDEKWAEVPVDTSTILDTSTIGE